MREGCVPTAKWGSLCPILHNFILRSIWGSQNTFTLQARAFGLMLMEVVRGRFEPPSGCLFNINTSPICAWVPIPFPSRAPLSGFEKLRSDFPNCLSRENTHTHTHAHRACLAHTPQLSFHLTTREKTPNGHEEVDNPQQTLTSFQELQLLCPHGHCWLFVFWLKISFQGLKAISWRRYLCLAPSRNCRNRSQRTSNSH